MPYAKRTILPGYPKSFVFECREDVEAYFAGDRITCLLCGLSFKGLDPHIQGVHQTSADEYREKYGLPYKRGLTSDATRDRRSEHSKEMFEQNREARLADLAKAKAVQAEFGNPQRNKPKFWKNERTKYGISDYEEFIRRVVEGRTVSDVAQDDDMPATPHVYWYMKRDKAFAEKYRAIIPLFAPIGKRLKQRQAALIPPA
jgi:hypothetical protein